MEIMKTGDLTCFKSGRQQIVEICVTLRLFEVALKFSQNWKRNLPPIEHCKIADTIYLTSKWQKAKEAPPVLPIMAPCPPKEGNRRKTERVVGHFINNTSVPVDFPYFSERRVSSDSLIADLVSVALWSGGPETVLERHPRDSVPPRGQRRGLARITETEKRTRRENLAWHCHAFSPGT